jgi:hypothetical protein
MRLEVYGRFLVRAAAVVLEALSVITLEVVVEVLVVTRQSQILHFLFQFQCKLVLVERLAQALMEALEQRRGSMVYPSMYLQLELTLALAE